MILVPYFAISYGLNFEKKCKRGPPLFFCFFYSLLSFITISGKIDVGRYPEVAEKHHINTSPLTRQLPTLILFQDGKETGRVPAILSGQVQKFTFKEEDIVNTFDLNSMYAELKKDKRFKEVAQPATSTEETKKDK